LTRTAVKYNKVLRLLILCLTWAFAVDFPGYLQALDPEKPINRYLLDEWDIGKGLTSESVYVVIQTPDGYLWLGAGEGIYRFDGLTFEQVYFEGPGHKADPDITALAIDKQGGLWIGSKGLIHYKNGELKYFSKEDGFSDYEIKCLATDSYGSLWIGTNYNSLFRYKDGTFTAFDKSSGLESVEIYSIMEDSSGNLWVANSDSGLFLGHSGKFVKHEIKGLKGEYSVYAVYEDRRGMLWVGTNVGLVGIANPGAVEEDTVYRFSPADGLSDNNIWTILEDNHGSLWVGTQNGLNRLKRNLDGTIIIENCLENVIIKYLFEDREENLWVGTIGSNLKRLRDSTFSTYWKNAGVPYWRLSLHQDSKGIIRIGSNVGDLYRFDRGNEIFQRVLRTNNNVESEIYAIEEDADGVFWLGTNRKGIILFKEPQGLITTYTTENGLTSNLIRTIMRDSRDRMWIGTIGGLTCYHQGTFRNYTTRDGLAGDMVFDIHEDKKNNIWIATYAGFNVLEKGEFQPGRVKTYLEGIFVTDIHEDSTDPDTSWIGTEGNGLKRFKNGQLASITREDGLASNTIYKILEDHRGILWIGSSDCIFRVGKEDLNAFADGRIGYFQSTAFGFSDGLKSLECRLGPRNSAIKTRDGEIWFGTRKGIAVVDPEKVSINKYPPPVLIKQIILNYEAIPMEQTGISVKGLEDIVFDFTVPTFVAPDKVQIQFKLEGYDQGWRSIRYPSPRRAHFRNLPPGQYCFHVIASNSSGVWNRDGSSFRFTVTPYFYQTLAFRIIVSIMGLSIVFGLYYGLKRYFYIRKLKKKYKNSTLDPQKAEECLKKLLQLLDVQKLYKDETLSLNTLSGKLSIAPRYLSQITNELLNKNFRDLINNYRIEEAKEMFLHPGKNDFSILEVAFEVGFNSKEVFNRCFKKYTGMTPSEFKKTNKDTITQ
jgi:ligand-binding sensor domain-containing protein/AraC-like DNA-binding protein